MGKIIAKDKKDFNRISRKKIVPNEMKLLGKIAFIEHTAKPKENSNG